MQKSIKLNLAAFSKRIDFGLLLKLFFFDIL